MNSYTKRGGAARRRFCVICKKPEGGGRKSTPPPGVRVLISVQAQTWGVSFRLLTVQDSQFLLHFLDFCVNAAFNSSVPT